MLSLVQSRLDWKLIFCVIGVLIPITAVFSVKAMVPFLCLLCLLQVIRLGKEIFNGGRIVQLAIIGAISLVIWSLLSVTWTLDVWVSIKTVFQLCILFSLGFCLLGGTNSLKSDELKFFIRGILAGSFCAIFLLFFEVITLSWITRQIKGIGWSDVFNHFGGRNLEVFFKDSLAILSLFCWPLIYYLWKCGNRILCALFVSSVLLLSSYFDAIAVSVSFLLAFTFILMGLKLPVLVGKILTLTISLAVIFTPLLVKPLVLKEGDVVEYSITAKFPPFVVSRLNIWDFTLEKIEEKPIIGWGIKSSSNMPGGEKVRKMVLKADRFGSKPSYIYQNQNLPLHPHNQILQIWLELGLIGAILVSLFIGIALWRFSKVKCDGYFRPITYGIIVEIVFFDLVSFGAWQSWWISVQFLSFALALGVFRFTNKEFQLGKL